MWTNIQSILILLLGVIGVLLIISKDTAIPTQLRTNRFVKIMYDNNMITGIVFIGLSYYFYTTLPYEDEISTVSESSIVETSETPELPSIEESVVSK